MEGSDIIFIALAMVASAFCFYAAFRNLSKSRTIENVPTSKIRSAAQGYAELNGTAKAIDGNPCFSPLTMSECVWYRYKIEKYKGGKNSSWSTLESARSQAFFLLDDTTGVCHIDPHRAEVSGTLKSVWYGDTKRPIVNACNSAQKKHYASGFIGAAINLNSRSRNGLFGGNYRYTEELLYSEDFLYVLGDLNTVYPMSIEESTKQKTKEILNEWKQDYQSLLKQFDTNGDGELDMQEWNQVRKKAAEQAKRYSYDNHDNDPIHVIAASPDRRKPFLISTSDQKQLATRYRWYAFFYAAGFLGLMAFAVQSIQKILMVQ